MTFEEWQQYGVDQGWSGPPVCSTHDGTPTSAPEDELFDAGYDPCVHIIRLYESDKGPLWRGGMGAVEANHPPSQWRKR